MPCYYLVAPAEASSNLARYDGVRYGPRVAGETYGEMVERTRDDGLRPEPKRRIMLGTYALSAGYYDAFYGQAQKVRTLLIREHRDALDGIDAIVTPDVADGRVPDRRQGGGSRSRCTPATFSRSRRASRGSRASPFRAVSPRGSPSGCS